MKYAGLEEYAKEHTIEECAELYNCCYDCMRSYIYKHKIEYLRKDIKGRNNSNYRHGNKGTRLYKIWINMRLRCNNPRYKQYKDYGGRGIKVCEEWNSFTCFSYWAEHNGYDVNLTLDRIDNDKGYSADNCRWTNRKVQNNNKRNNHLISFLGKTYTLSQWAEISGINKGTFISRIVKYKKPIEEALGEERVKELTEALKQGKELLDMGVTDVGLFKYFG